MPGPAYWLMRRLMWRYWRMTRALTLGAQGLIIDDKDRVLLLRHAYRPGWHFPGGGVELHETAETALARELDEEVGVRLTERPALFGIYANFRAFPGDHVLLYVCRRWTQPHPPAPNREVAEHGFFARSALPADLVKAARLRLCEVLDGAPRAQEW